MNLTEKLAHALQDSLLGDSERIRLSCALAWSFQNEGEHEAACGALRPFWRGAGVRPNVEGLEREIVAEVLLRVGSLSSRLSSMKSTGSGQEAAKDLLSEAFSIFESLGLRDKTAETQIHLGFCYRVEEDFEEARIHLRAAIDSFSDAAINLKCLALLDLAVVEKVANRSDVALAILRDSAALFLNSQDDLLLGKRCNEVADNLNRIDITNGTSEHREQVLLEYLNARIYFEAYGHKRYIARVDNNVGYCHAHAGNFPEAHENLARARASFSRLGDLMTVAHVDVTRAEAFLEEGLNDKAERVSRDAAEFFEANGARANLIEALFIHGRALARGGKTAEAHRVLERACEVGERAGHFEVAGMALLILLEETGASLDSAALCDLFERTDRLFGDTSQPDILKRLRTCAARAVSAATALSTVIAADSNEVAPSEFVYASPSTRQLLLRARQYAASREALLITGQTGTGKEVLARLLHQWSGYPGESFIVANCAAFTEGLFESQLFGHERGSFTGAIKDRPGLARTAAGGTLFLDEVADLSAANQVKLLRLVDYNEILPVGADKPQKVNLRIIAATNRSLEDEVKCGRFRSDLYYRLAILRIHLPPLHERSEDIAALARHYIGRMEARYSRRIVFTEEAIEYTKQLPLHGNARELRSILEKIFATAPQGAVISPELVGLCALGQTDGLEINLWQGEAERIESALKATGGKVTAAARMLNMAHQTLVWKIKHQHPQLMAYRKPARPRRKTLIKKESTRPRLVQKRSVV